MMTASDARRRWLGLLFLVGAVSMMVAGLTILQSRLEGWYFLLYWMGCFVLTMIAVLIAFIDLCAIRHHTRDEQRDLIQKALEDVDKAQEHGSQRAPPRD